MLLTICSSAKRAAETTLQIAKKLLEIQSDTDGLRSVRRGKEEGAAPVGGRAFPAIRRLLGAQPGGQVLVGDEIHVGAQEVVDDARKIRASQSPVISKSAPRIIPAFA